MKLRQLFQESKNPLFSFEFFLPKTPEGMTAFKSMVSDLRTLKPSFVTLTYGAGGSDHGRTLETAGMMKNELKLETVAHLTCIAHTRQEIKGLLDEVRHLGIENIMALRGDMPKMGGVPGEYFHAVELVRDIRAFTHDAFSIGVAGYPEKHPEAPSKESDLYWLKEKVDAGADVVTTQLFFDNEDYFSFVKRARAAGITTPIVPGLMPVTNQAQLQRFTTMCGTKIPDEMSDRLANMKNDADEVIRFGIDWCFKQAQGLLAGGAPGIHFYTLNKSLSTLVVLSRLRAGL
jgi:methylenetetrahydrofolate reductase (NADPH)